MAKYIQCINNYRFNPIGNGIPCVIIANFTPHDPSPVEINQPSSTNQYSTAAAALLVFRASVRGTEVSNNNMSGAASDDQHSNKRLKKCDADSGESPEGGPTKIDESPTKEELKAQLAEMKKNNAEQAKAIAKYKKTQTRRSLQTLLTLKESQFVLQRIGTDNSHVNGARAGASAGEKPFALIDLECGNKEKVPLDSASRIVMRLVKQVTDQDCEKTLEFQRLQYSTEADVATLVHDVLLDAIDVAKYLKVVCDADLAVYQERSLFSGRPDILVVRSSAHHLPLLVVEVKKPVRDGRLCDKDKALGQAYDYAESLRACGHQEPLVILSSLEESCVCWNREEDEAEEGRYAEDFDIESFCKPTPQKQNASSNTTSATPPMLRSSGSVHSVSQDERDLFFEPVPERKFYRSKVFKANKLVHVLCTVLCRAFSSAQMQTEKFIYYLQPNATYEFSNVLRFISKKVSYTWGKLKVRVGAPILTRGQNSAANENEVAYYLIGKLGHGATSNVWHALDSGGNEVVIKMYVKTTDETRRVLDEKDFEQQAQRATKREVEKLKLFYPFLKEKVKHAELGGFHCVVMPFFCPVPKEKRGDTLGKVEKVLTDIFCEKKFKYADEDVRWSHIGNYVESSTRTHLILYDLAGLVPEEENEPWVERHLNILKNRIGVEQEPDREPFVCKEVSQSDDKERLACKTTGE